MACLYAVGGVVGTPDGIRPAEKRKNMALKPL